MVKVKKATGQPAKFCVEIVPDTEQGGFTAHVPSIPAYGEGETEEEAIADLREALIGFVEAFGLEDTLARVTDPPKIRFVQWKLDPCSDA